ncbi:uncharacterized protein [Venturia canescens]|uniref:uncharacterized protein n=1 Tax=Venturia canescens TaxID=32260 RepID=UPI001C9CAC29|nr:uncharacterized protein LOC122409659 [Venturia canescens]
MGSQQIDTDRRMFRRPVMPINRSINRGRISNISERSEKNESNKSWNNNDTSEIMETEKITNPATSAPERQSYTTVPESLRNVVEAEKSPENVDQSVENIYEMATQKTFEPPMHKKKEAALSGVSKKVGEPEKSLNNVDASDDVHEMETQNVLETPLRNKKDLTVRGPSRILEEPEKPSNNVAPLDDIFEMETQNVLVPLSRNKNELTVSESSKNVAQFEKFSKNVDLPNDIYEMETQNVLKPPLRNENDSTEIGSSKKSAESEKSPKNVDLSGDIYEMETQNVLKPPLPNENNSTVNRSSKRVKGPEKLSENVDSNDIYNMETQDLLNREPLPVPKRPKLERFAEIFMDDADDSVYEAETQILIEPEEYFRDHDVTNKSAPKETSVIAETDDESKTDDESGYLLGKHDDNDSDGSVTDGENQFAGLSSNMTTKAKAVPKTSTLSSEAMNKPKSGINAQSENISPASTTVGGVNDDEDLDLVPTQVMTTSTPMVNRSKIPEERIDESQVVLDDIDIHDVLTQVGPTSHRNSPDSSTSIPDTKEEKEKNKANKMPELDDTLDKNMGNIFGQDTTSDGEPMEEATQLMTQNLVDILRPTQITARDPTPSPSDSKNRFDTTDQGSPGDDKTNDTDEILGFVAGRAIANQSKTHLGKSPPSHSKNRFDPADQGSPGDKTNDTGEILGFVDGRAVGNETKASCAVSSTSANQSEIHRGKSKEKTPQPANSDLTLPPCSEDEDILFGLPKVRISGTLSNPGSPASSETSDNDLFWLKNRGKSGNKGSPWKRKFSSISTKSKMNKTRDANSQVLSGKSRVIGANLSSNRVGEEDDDSDSDEDMDYNELKNIADRLLASGSTNDTNVHPTESDSSEDGTENKVIELSTRGSRKRPRGSTRNSRAEKKIMKKESSEESRKAEDVDPNDRLTPVMTPQQYAKVHLTRLSESEFKANKVDPPQTKITTSKVMKLSTSKVAKDSTSSPTTPSRSRPRRTMDPNASSTNQRHKVLFTCVKDEDYERMVVELGGIVVTDPSKATVLITDKVRRTFKFLCAVAQGIKVVSVNWLIESIDAGHFLDCENFILRDPEAEKKFKFKLAKSLQAARTNKLLTGFTILVTPKVNQPEIHEIKGMVEAAGGRVLVRAGNRSWSDKMVIISQKDDLAAAKAFLSKAPKGLKPSVQSTEFLLTGILRQEVNLVDHKLL